MKRLAAVSVALAAAAASPAGASAAAPHARTALTPQPAFLGDVVQAQLTVSANAPASAQPSFGPFRILGTSRRVTRTGGVVVTTLGYRLQCLDAACAPGPGRRLVTLPRVRVSAGGSSALVGWPAAIVEPRVAQSAIAHPQAAFRRQTAVPSPVYAHSPRRLQLALYAAAALLVLAALALLVPLARRRARAGAASPLDVALARVRESQTRPPEDRRRALDLLARALARAGHQGEARAAADLAWSQSEPEPARVAALADVVEASR